ncbi:MAG TPA: hypothetical protein VFF39_10520, partial [Verrucomicrobiae bacterium]|nr:hypothetical protein [Verrucomicrobiae bacterium]
MLDFDPFTAGTPCWALAKPLNGQAGLPQYPNFLFSEQELKMLPQASIYAMFSSRNNKKPLQKLLEIGAVS